MTGSKAQSLGRVQKRAAQEINSKQVLSKKRETMRFKVEGTQETGLISGTNDSSIVSKRSVERTGYAIKSVEHQWFRHFVKRPVRRAPLINLGYFIRMQAIERAVDEVCSKVSAC